MRREIFQPRIKRQETPPKMTGRRGYLKAREYLRRDFENRCAYCMIHETQGGGAEAFWIDHFKPRSKGGYVNDYNNLYWACMPSPPERRKGYRFADLC